LTERRKLRFGIAGMASDHVWDMGEPLAALPEVELVAAAESYPGLVEEARAKWGIRSTYSDILPMLEQEDLDAILVCSDNTSKADIVEAAAKKGIHVYQDKPMAATLAEAERMLKAAESSGIKLMVAYHSAFGPLYPKLKEIIQGGGIGNPYLARGVTGHAGPKEVGCAPSFCEFLFDRRRNGGGSFVDEGCYQVDTFLDYFGPIVEVSAFMTQMGHRDYLPPGVEDNSIVMLRFASGALGVIDAKWGQIGPMPLRNSYHGDRGTIALGASGTELFSTISGPPEGWEEFEIRAGFGQSTDLKGWRAPAGMSRRGGGAEQRYFVQCLLQDRPIEGPVSPRHSRNVQEVIDAAYRSAESGKAVAIPQ
jgi:predicted dehydrogenase